jgi:hypothetical protein
MSPATCQYHCGGCGRHFASLEAFDLHRRGDHDAGRYCVHPVDLEGDSPRTRLVAKTKHGKCDIGREALHGVWIWQVERDAMKGPRPARVSETGGDAVTASEPSGREMAA